MVSTLRLRASHWRWKAATWLPARASAVAWRARHAVMGAGVSPGRAAALAVAALGLSAGLWLGAGQVDAWRWQRLQAMHQARLAQEVFDARGLWLGVVPASMERFADGGSYARTRR